MSVDYLESLFTGIDIILSQRLSDLSNDKTIVCTVVNNDNKKNGEYTVSDGSIQMKAYADSDKYNVNDQVLVKIIPNQDYRYIEGRYTSNNSINPVTYVSPLSKALSVSGNFLESDMNTQWGIKANGAETIVPIKEKLFDKDDPLAKIQGEGLYDTVLLKADFKTLFTQYNNLINGKYGLKLIIYTKATQESTKYCENIVELDSSEMFGNPYNFIAYSTQGKVFKLRSEGYIHGFALYLYQDGNFKDAEKGELNNLKIDLPHDILVNNIELGIGSDLNLIADNTLKLYTTSNTQYQQVYPTDETQNKKLKYSWYNKDQNNKYLGFSDGVYDAKYDERKYLEEKAKDLRLKLRFGQENVPSDKQSLYLKANIDEGKENIVKAKDSITGSYYNELDKLINALKYDN